MSKSSATLCKITYYFGVLKKYQYSTLLEIHTYLGDMVEVVKKEI
jgi:hypothetical protein